MHFLAVILIAHKVVLLVKASYELEILVDGYQNPNSRQADGRCCDLVTCSACENAFIFCIQPMEDETCDTEMRSGLITDEGDDDLEFSEGDDIGRLSNPLVIPGLEFPVEILLKVYDLDSSSDIDSLSDHVDDITINPNITLTSDTFSDVMSFSGIRSFAHIQLAFRLSCSTHYYGTDCSHYCVDTNDDTGHYSCDTSTGNKLCLDGYLNPATNCTECTQPALNCSRVGGYCREPGECLCREGFSGENCAVGASSLVFSFSTSLATSSHQTFLTSLPSPSHTTIVAAISSPMTGITFPTEPVSTSYTRRTSSMQPTQPSISIAVPTLPSETTGIAFPLVISIAVNVLVIVAAVAAFTLIIVLVCLRRRAKRNDRRYKMSSKDDVKYKSATDEVKIKAAATHDEDANHVYDTISTYAAVNTGRLSTATAHSYAAVNAVYDVVYDDTMTLESNAYDTVKVEDNVAYGVTTQTLNRQMVPLPNLP